MTGQLSLSIAPFSWFGIGLSYLRSGTKWEVENPNSKEAFELAMTDYVDSVYRIDQYQPVREELSMTDRQWLRNLATANFQGGQWALADPEEARDQITLRLEDTIPALLAEARDACEVYNLYATGRKSIRVLPLGPVEGKTEGGLVLLSGHLQLKLEYVPPRLTSTLVAVRYFAHGSKPLHVFEPQFDSFGTLRWNMDKSGLLFSNELIIKKLFRGLAPGFLRTWRQ